jgi:proteic killer suppression protein
MIRGFRNRNTQNIFEGIRVKEFQAIERVALRKLIQLNRARNLNDLRSPGNSLEALKGDRAGQHSIRINDQYRICFTWQVQRNQGDAYDVEIVDYH